MTDTTGPDTVGTGYAGPPTVHADADRTAATGAGVGTATAPRRDPVLLVAGLVVLVVAVLAVLGPSVLAAFDPRWVLAAAALAVGVAVLATTVRRRR